MLNMYILCLTCIADYLYTRHKAECQAYRFVHECVVKCTCVGLCGGWRQRKCFFTAKTKHILKTSIVDNTINNYTYTLIAPCLYRKPLHKAHVPH